MTNDKFKVKKLIRNDEETYETIYLLPLPNGITFYCLKYDRFIYGTLEKVDELVRTMDDFEQLSEQFITIESDSQIKFIIDFCDVINKYFIK